MMLGRFLTKALLNACLIAALVASILPSWADDEKARRRPTPPVPEEELEPDEPVKPPAPSPKQGTPEDTYNPPELKKLNDSFKPDPFWKAENLGEPKYAQFRSITGDAPTRLLNTKKISLKYALQSVGPSGVAQVEVWHTTDTQKWNKFSEVTNPRGPLVLEVDKEGMHGFTMLVRSGVGLAKLPPKPGDAPQIWVEVDVTQPVVKLEKVLVGSGPQSGLVTIHWTASDKNLGAEPITLSYGPESGGPWMPIAMKIKNTGKHEWRIPPRIPYRFLVRVHAVDKAGNIGSDQSTQPTLVDLTTPEGVILGVDPVSK